MTNKILIKIFSLFTLFFKKEYFGFITTNYFLSDKNLSIVKKLINVNDVNIQNKFQKKFTKFMARGECLTFASGRMGFYFLMKSLKIKKGDEVIISAGTCSVMVNAILRCNAKPIFTDINLSNFGSDYSSIKHSITKKTKLIVAQHTGGIPCEIDGISKLCKQKSILLLEDCALSFGSTYKGLMLGTYGDFALYSMDHSKPINSMIGGIIHFNKKSFYNTVLNDYINLPELNKLKQLKLYRRAILESFFNSPMLYPKLLFLNPFLNLFSFFKDPFLSDDYTEKFFDSYEYPCKLPSSFSYIGILYLEKWSKIKKERKKILNLIIKQFYIKKLFHLIPKIYFQKNVDIVPLRFIYIDKLFQGKLKNFSKFIEISSIWFKKPIESCSIPVSKFGYKKKQCSNIENYSGYFVNLPCNFNQRHSKTFIKKIAEII